MKLFVTISALLASTAVAFSPSSSFVRGVSSVGHSMSSSSSALCMKTIAVFGSSGLTSQECVYQALKDGDSVVGLTR